MIWKNAPYKRSPYLIHIYYNFTVNQTTPFWYLDFEAYKVYGSFYVKEIAILKNDRTQCWIYYISHHGITVPTSYEFQRQASQLQFAWSFG